MATQRHRQHNVPNPVQPTITNEDLSERVSHKAYELYQQRGEEPGHALEDWLTAERLVQEELRHGLSVKDPILDDDLTTADDSVAP